MKIAELRKIKEKLNKVTKDFRKKCGCDLIGRLLFTCQRHTK